MKVITITDIDIEKFDFKLESVLNDPPANHFVQEVQFNTAMVPSGNVRKYALVIYGEFPT